MSRVYRWDDKDDKAFRAVAAALCKMTRATVKPFADPFDKLNQRTVLRFEKGDDYRLFWDHLKHLKKGDWDNYADPSKYMYAIEDLGRGADGRVWLTCSDGGAVCVLKFSNEPFFAKYLQHEERMWHKAYPQFKNKVRVLKLVEQTLREDFDGKNLVHGDVAWRNVGLYKNGSEVKAVVFDMTQVKERGESHDGWVDAAVQKLRRATRQDV